MGEAGTTWADELYQIMRRYRITQAEVARKLGLRRETVNRMLTGAIPVPLPLVFGIPAAIEAIISDERDPSRPYQKRVPARNGNSESVHVHAKK